MLSRCHMKRSIHGAMTWYKSIGHYIQWQMRSKVKLKVNVGVISKLEIEKSKLIMDSPSIEEKEGQALHIGK